jgi:hypothetical protein
LQPDGRNIISSRDIYAHLRRLNLICSESISSVAEYRTIIQGKTGTGRDRQRQRSLAADFAFVGSGHHLTHIEKIVSGMFLRRTNFEDLQRMVVSCIAEGPGQIALSTERKKIESWPEHYEAYREVMQEAPCMDQVLAAEMRLLASEAELGRLHARLRRLNDHLEEASRRNRANRERLTQEADEAETLARRQVEQLEGERDTARREAEDREGRVVALQDQDRDYAKRDLPAKAKRVADEPRLRDEWEQRRQRKLALLGQQQDISIRYDGLLLEQRNRFNEERERAQRERTLLEQGFSPRFRDLEQAKDQELTALREVHRQAREQVDQRLRAVLGEVGGWKEKARNPQAAPDILAAHQSKRDAVAQAMKALEEARTEQQRLEKLRNEARQAFDEQEARLGQLRGQRQKQADRLQALRLQQTPGPDSLLYFLRSQRPDWVFDIAKVVREDILVREDLEPELLDALPSLYGVGVDLERLDAHLAADEQGLQREAAEIEARLHSADAAIADAGVELDKCNQRRDAAQQALAMQEAEVQRQVTQRQSAQEEEQAAGKQVEKNRKEVAAQAQAMLADLGKQSAALGGELQTLDQKLRDDEGERVRRYTSERSALEAERKQLLDLHDHAQAKRKTVHEGQLLEMQQEKEKALRSAGVNTEALGRLEKEISDLERQLQEARDWQEAVAQWRLWLEQEWPRRDGWTQEAVAARRTEADKKAELVKLLAEREAARQRVQAEVAALDKEFNRLAREQDTVRQRLVHVAAYLPDAEALGQAFDPAWTLELLAQQANERLREVARELETIRKHIGEIKRAFVTRRDTPPEQFYDAHRQALGPDASERAWIAAFKSWFSSDHDQYRRTLQVEANQIAGAIVAFHRDMEIFHRKVQQFSRELQQSLDDSLSFESISRVTVQIVSVIRELEYWQSIDGMAEAHRVWLGQEGNELPPPEFAATLRDLLSHWEVREGIRAELASLIRIQGEVVENGQTRVFRKAADLERVSSNGCLT